MALRRVTAEEILEHTARTVRESSKIEFDDAARVVTLRWRYPYHIGYERIDRPEKLLRWLIHLSEKNWMTKERLILLAEACGTHFGYAVRGA